MCGICGIFGLKVDQNLLQKMMSSMSHRGPDGSGFFVGEKVGLGHRRLSIIDLQAGTQPMTNERGDLQIVFNGEIYNYVELKVVLEGKGHVFKTRSDTEVIVHAYEEWGERCVSNFNGMFAFAIWDKRRDQLFLARDHLGIKPLYYLHWNGGVLFASEIKALLQFSECPREVDIASLGDLFTYRYVPSPRTLFKHIYKLPPGHTFSVSREGSSIKRFWLWKPVIDQNQRKGDVIARYQELLEDAIRIQLRSDVPVGLFLSSGVDSGAILAVMAKHIPDAIHTFTLGFEGGEGTNETCDAKRMAKSFGANHTEMIIGPRDYQRYYEKYLWDLEEPVGNETAAAFFFVSRMASEHVKVALTGQGADEPWAGYPRYLGVRLSEIYSKLPSPVTRLMQRCVMALPRSERLKRGVLSLGEPEIMARFNKIYSFFSAEMKERLFKEWIKDSMACRNERDDLYLVGLQKEVNDLDALTQMLYIDTRANLPDDLLMVNDKTSMANSLETRVPYLDFRLVELIESLPPTWKLHGFEGKHLHKKALQKWLPREIVYRKKKGFANPIKDWLRVAMNKYVEECLLSSESSIGYYFDKEYVKTLVRLHTENREEYLRHIYLLISFELWHRTFIKGNVGRSHECSR